MKTFGEEDHDKTSERWTLALHNEDDGKLKRIRLDNLTRFDMVRHVANFIESEIRPTRFFVCAILNTHTSLSAVGASIIEGENLDDFKRKIQFTPEEGVI